MTNNIKEIVKKYDKNFVDGALWFTLITRPARNYIVFAKKVDGVKRTYGWHDRQFLNGYQTIKRTDVKVLENGFTKSVWHFQTIKNYQGIGYIVSSFRDSLDVQVSKETHDIIYQMILENQKNYPNSEVIIENLW